jgi:hypothetical protein
MRQFAGPANASQLVLVCRRMAVDFARRKQTAVAS